MEFTRGVSFTDGLLERCAFVTSLLGHVLNPHPEYLVSHRSASEGYRYRQMGWF